MRFIDAIRISVRMLGTNLLRSILTMLGIGVAVAVITVLVALGYGLQDITVGSILQSQNLLSMDVTPAAGSGAELDLARLAAIKKVPGVVDAVPVLTATGDVTLDGKTGAVSVVATRRGFLAMDDVGLDEGTPFTDGAGMVVSPQVPGLVGAEGSGIGRSLSVRIADGQGGTYALTAEIVGVTEPSDAPTVYVPFDLLPTDGGPAPIDSIKALGIDRDGVASAAATLQGQGYAVETLYDSLDQARSIFRWITLGLGLFGTIALVVAGIGMFNTLTIALLERTKEFGIMKTIGFTDGAIRKLFLVEAGIIGFGGGCCGIALALLTESVIGTVMNQVFIRYGGEKLELFQNPNGLLIAMLSFPIVLGLVTGIYPALRAAKLNPLRALRYE